MAADPSIRTPGGTFTVEQVAERYAVTVATVAGWIRSGELRAINVSRKAASGKPRWRVTQAALDEFEAIRATTPAALPTRTRRRATRPADVIEFYPTAGKAVRR